MVDGDSAWRGPVDPHPPNPKDGMGRPQACLGEDRTAVLPELWDPFGEEAGGMKDGSERRRRGPAKRG